MELLVGYQHHDQFFPAQTFHWLEILGFLVVDHMGRAPYVQMYLQLASVMVDGVEKDHQTFQLVWNSEEFDRVDQQVVQMYPAHLELYYFVVVGIDPDLPTNLVWPLLAGHKALC